MIRCRAVAQSLARVACAGPWTPVLLASDWERVCPGAPVARLTLLAAACCEAFRGRKPSERAVASWLEEQDALRRLVRLKRFGFDALAEHGFPPRFLPGHSWPVPALADVGGFAAWLGLEVPVLLWLADDQGRERRSGESLRHYRRRWLAKRNGLPRLIESPKATLAAIQRRTLRELLEAIPPHPAAHGFVRGRSVLSFAAPHVGRRLVLRLDLKDFFPSIARARVAAVFRHAGYPAAVTRLLTGLCVTVTPSDVLAKAPLPKGREEGEMLGEARQALRHLYGKPHLAQGAPTSPALANLCALRLDRRLAGLASAGGANYTRYADDLVFSGDAPGFVRGAERFLARVGAIVLEEGFTPHFRKTRVMHHGGSQRAAGLVLNEKPNLPRRDYDQLKAILHDAVLHGPETANREGRPEWRAHLMGKLAWWEQVNPLRAAKLRTLFERIVW